MAAVQLSNIKNFRAIDSFSLARLQPYLTTHPSPHSQSANLFKTDAGRRGGRQAHTKGRGFRQQNSDEGGDRYSGKLGDFDSFDEQHAGVQKCAHAFRSSLLSIIFSFHISIRLV